MKFPSSNAERPYPRTPQVETGGLGIQPRIKRQSGSRLPLQSRWVVGEDGRLTCQWMPPDAI